MDAEGDAVFAGGLRIIWVVPRAPDLASTAGIATCGRKRCVNTERAEMKRDRGRLLCDWRLT